MLNLVDENGIRNGTFDGPEISPQNLLINSKVMLQKRILVNTIFISDQINTINNRSNWHYVPPDRTQLCNVGVFGRKYQTDLHGERLQKECPATPEMSKS